jgi:hypothetical protein
VRGGAEGAGSGVRVEKTWIRHRIRPSCQWPDPVPVLEGFPVSPSAWALGIVCLPSSSWLYSTVIGYALRLSEDEINL